MNPSSEPTTTSDSSPRIPRHTPSRPKDLGSWMRFRQRRRDSRETKRRAQKFIKRCHFCDCEYDTRRYGKCYKCGASEGDLSIVQKIRQSIRKFWRWFH